MNVFTKFFVVLGLAYLGAVVVTNCAKASTLDEVAASTYRLYSGSTAHCSIVAVSPTQFVTAFHCVDKMKDLNVRTIEENDKFEPVTEEVRYLKVLRGLKSKDVAFLELKSDKAMPNLAYVDIAPEDTEIKFGEAMIHVGYPAIADLTVTDGLFTNLVKSPFSDEDPVYKNTVPVTGGSSGGGFYRVKAYKGFPDRQEFRERNGLSVRGNEYELVGTTIGMSTRTSFQTYISTTKAIYDVMRGLLDKEEPVKVEESDTAEKPKVEEPVDTKDLIRPEEIR